MDIRFISNESIDKTKWNSCIHFANNGNIFGYKWFLDFIAKDWDALVEGDYESVFPLTWKKNFWGRKYLHQPTLIRELGIFSINVLSEKRIQAFLEAIPDQFRGGNIFLNEQNKLSDQASLNLTPFPNYQLWLKDDYDILSEQFSDQITPVYENGKSAGLSLTTSIKPEKIADFFIAHSTENTKTKEAKSHQLLRIMYNALHRGWGSASGVLDKNGQLLAVNFFLFSHGKAVSLVPVESKVGAQKMPYISFSICSFDPMQIVH